ncbi:MAG: integrase family protein [Gammaproteobacteria bacterium]|nr:integrase family protein [Rhodocyclaceae bacterium]MBU3907599.1 integrase family protein [Gammaproteobacteria bacterium]MBU4004245.1 integrase family protein [Gammaproteobacteria bacterium]MBU4019654.1 integrase family protein [Gammaproteobacteria bacterium]MBU4095053.1 integrase family protein [Gammaproteobacteria bacterium]
MAKRANFTAERIARFQCEPGRQQTIHWDGKTPGLGLRVTAAGAKSYVFETSLCGKTLRITIGDPRTWSIGKAQAKATELKTLTDQDIDPRQLRRERAAAVVAANQAEQRKDLTVGEAWQVYIGARTPKWGERHLRNHLYMVQPGGKKRTRGKREGDPDTIQPGPLYPLLSLRMSALNAEAVRAWLEPLAAKTPTQAAQTYRALRAFTAWCADRPEYVGLVHDDACNRRMARDVLPKAKAKTDCLQREQLATWFTEVRKIGNPVISVYLQALLLTGARREEMARLRWDDVDFRWKSLTIRDKVEGERTIPLTPYLASLLTRLKQINDTPPEVDEIRGKKEPKGEDEKKPKWKPSEWVFSSRTAKSGRLQEPRINHNKALTAAGLPALTLHGLRRSFGTLTEWVECPAGVVAQIMGHKPSATAEKHYKVRPLDLLRMWHTRIEAWTLEQAGIEFKQADKQAKPGLREVA